jgi:hypothetical protein
MNEARPYASLSSGLLARKGAAKPAMRPQGFAQGYGNLEDLGWNDMGHGSGEPAAPAAPAEHVPSSIAALTPAPKIQRTYPGDAPFAADDEDDGGCEENEQLHEAEPPEAFGLPEEPEQIHAAEQAFEDPEAPAEPEPETAEEPSFEASHEPVEPEALDDQAIADAPFEAPSVVAQQRAILERFDGEEEVVSALPEPAALARAEIVPLPQHRPMVADARKAAFTLRLDSDRHLRLRLACAVSGRSAQQIVARALDEALSNIPEIEALASQCPAKPGRRAK